MTSQSPRVSAGPLPAAALWLASARRARAGAPRRAARVPQLRRRRLLPDLGARLRRPPSLGDLPDALPHRLRLPAGRPVPLDPRRARAPALSAPARPAAPRSCCSSFRTSWPGWRTCPLCAIGLRRPLRPARGARRPRCSWRCRRRCSSTPRPGASSTRCSACSSWPPSSRCSNGRALAAGAALGPRHRHQAPRRGGGARDGASGRGGGAGRARVLAGAAMALAVMVVAAVPYVAQRRGAARPLVVPRRRRVLPAADRRGLQPLVRARPRRHPPAWPALRRGARRYALRSGRSPTATSAWSCWPPGRRSSWPGCGAGRATAGLILAAAFQFFAVFMLPTQMHQRYILPAAVLLALVAPLSRAHARAVRRAHGDGDPQPGSRPRTRRARAGDRRGPVAGGRSARDPRWQSATPPPSSP